MEYSSNDCNRCNPLQSTDCVKYVGPAIPCLNICTGDNLTKVQWIIATQLCTVVGELNLSTLEIPQCLKELWGINNVTVLNLFQFILNTLCGNKEEIDNINNTLSTFDPTITLNYACLGDVCLVNNTLTLSSHLQNLINYICDLKSQVNSLSDQILALENQNQVIQNQFNSLSSQVATINQTLFSGTNNLVEKVACIEIRISQDSDIPSTC